MGCICCKRSSSAVDVDVYGPHADVAAPDKLAWSYASGKQPRLQQQQANAGGRKKESQDQQQQLEEEEARERHMMWPVARVGVPKSLEGEQVAAGWPAWLARVAGEAIRGWVPRRADSFEKLDKIGQGTYSNVYRARDLESGKVVALKKVRFDNLEPESVRFMAREIHILRQLDHPNVVKLEGLVTSRMSCSLYLVFEYMEHDLAGLASYPGNKFTEPQIKCYMQQLLCGLEHSHSRGVLHRDIKGSNLLIDNSGVLKIADFGLASFFDPNQHHQLTSRVVTLWYRPPELLLGATNYGVAVDLWSTGCILAELYAGKPIMPGRTEVEQLHKIFKLCGSPSEEYWRKAKLPHATIFKPQQPYKRCVAETFKNFPQPALALMEVLLSIDPADRGTATSALNNEFFTTEPLPCVSSSLPKYPPSKEFDAKIRDEETRRRGATGGKVQRTNLERKEVLERRAVPAPDANAELPQSMLKRQGLHDKSKSEKFNLQNEEVASGFPIEPPRQVPLLEEHQDPQCYFSNRASHSGPLVRRTQWSKANKINADEAPKVSLMANYAALSAWPSRNYTMLVDGNGKPDVNAVALRSSGRFSECRNEPSDASGKHDQLYHGCAGSCRKAETKIDNTEISAQQTFGSNGPKIHYSGPLVRTSGSMDQMLKDHDRQIQQVFRRSRHEKARTPKIQVTGSHTFIRPLELGSIPVFPASRGSVLVSNQGSVRY